MLTGRPPKSSQRPMRCSLGPIFRLSRALNASTTLWVYRTSTFHFLDSHLPDFFWRIGPTNRSHLRHLSFRFDSSNLPYELRWFLPGEVVKILRVHLTPEKCYWRCLVRDMLKEIRLASLTIFVNGIPKMLISLVVKAFKGSFGSIYKVKFVRVSDKLVVEEISADEAGAGEADEKSWYQHV